jgi:hypothetical protein
VEQLRTSETIEWLSKEARRTSAFLSVINKINFSHQSFKSLAEQQSYYISYLKECSSTQTKLISSNTVEFRLNLWIADSQESWLQLSHKIKNLCFLAFSDLCFGKDFELMGSDKIRTALRSYRCIVCPSVSPLSLPLTKSSNSEKNVHIWSWFFPLLCSHSWIISHDFLKWYKTSVVFTTVFHRALLSCRWQQSWIVSGVWILAPWLWLRCWLRDVQSSLISIPV